MQHYQSKKGESATDEDMCILHDRKSGSGHILQALPASPAGNTHAERSYFAHDPHLAPGSVCSDWTKLLPFSSRSFLVSTATPTLIPTGQLTPGLPPTRINEPVVISACVSDTTRIRRGPGTQYETIGGLVSGTCLTILGRNADASWVSMVSEDHQTGWVAASLLPNAGDLSRVSVRDNSALANSARPTLTGAEIAHGAQAYLTKSRGNEHPSIAPHPIRGALL